jgi:hypothetical protein
MRPVAFGEALPAGTRLTLFSDDKPDRFFTVIQFWMDATSGVALDLKTGVPTYPSRRRPAAPKACRRREEGRTHLLIHLPIEEEGEDRWRLWRTDRQSIITHRFTSIAFVRLAVGVGSGLRRSPF